MMSQFGTIFKFEFKSYLKNKVFVGVTIFLMLVIAIVMFFPRIRGLFSDSGSGAPSYEDTGEYVPGSSDIPDIPGVSDDRTGSPVMLVKAADSEQESMIFLPLRMAFGGYDVKVTSMTEEEIRQDIADGHSECALLFSDDLHYTYLVNNLSMYDNNAQIADAVLQRVYQIKALSDLGLSENEASDILLIHPEGETVNLGVDQMQNYWYTYIMIMALYMVILLYGQMVATNVATEKSSRAMELLVTSARPVSMMFGKVLASCLAGFVQLAAVFGTAILCFRLNQPFWEGSMIIRSIFDMPPALLGYMLLFFVLGFLMYAFMYGAIGSTASKLEDINTSVMPVTLLFIAGFFVVIFSMTTSVDNTVLKICSFVPFTSPMAMFTRIAMSTVPWIEIVISVVILILSVIGVGVLSARIYRVGVLMYGTPPKIGTLLKNILGAGGKHPASGKEKN